MSLQSPHSDSTLRWSSGSTLLEILPQLEEGDKVALEFDNLPERFTVDSVSETSVGSTPSHPPTDVVLLSPVEDVDAVQVRLRGKVYSESADETRDAPVLDTFTHTVSEDGDWLYQGQLHALEVSSETVQMLSGISASEFTNHLRTN